MRRSCCAVLLTAFLGCSEPPWEKKPALAPTDIHGPHAVLETSRGDIHVRLLPKEAPKAVDNFVKLANRSFYDGTLFFRAIPGFMIQGGDPLNNGTGGPGYAFNDEFFAGRSFNRAGLVAMANSGPNTNGSQFFITLDAAHWLDGKHTVFGEVVKGQEVVEAIAAAPRVEKDPATGRAIDRPIAPQVLNKVRIEER